MVARKAARGSLRSAEAAELLSDALGVAVHDLGGAVAALELRADALAAEPGGDGAGLRAIAREVRETTRLLRLLRGPRGGEALAPARGLGTVGWWRHVERLTRAALPRGTVVTATCADGNLTPSEAMRLAYAWMAACRDVAARDSAVPLTIAVEVHPVGPDGTGASITARCTPWPGGEITRGTGWRRFASRLPGVAVEWWSPDGPGARCNVRITASG